MLEIEKQIFCRRTKKNWRVLSKVSNYSKVYYKLFDYIMLKFKDLEDDFLKKLGYNFKLRNFREFKKEVVKGIKIE